MEEVAVGKISTVYGIYINFDGLKHSLAFMESCEADRKVEVAIRCNGTIKEFTVAEFLAACGFQSA